jgi:hypothetical protein
MTNKMTLKEKILAGLCIAGICGTMGCGIIPRVLDEGEVGHRNYIVPRKFEMNMTDLDRDGRKETVASYQGKDYLFRLGTNGVPYLEQIKGLEIKLEK